MKLDGLGRLRQLKGMHMMADFLHISLEAYVELEFQLRDASHSEREILRQLLKIE